MNENEILQLIKRSVSDKDRLDSIDFDYKYDTKKKTVRCVLRKNKESTYKREDMHSSV